MINSIPPVVEPLSAVEDAWRELGKNLHRTTVYECIVVETVLRLRMLFKVITPMAEFGVLPGATRVSTEVDDLGPIAFLVPEPEFRLLECLTTPSCTYVWFFRITA